MKKLSILLFLILSANVLARGIPERMQTDEIQLGHSTLTDPIELEWNVGDGASNPKMSVDKVLKTFDMSKPLRVQGDLTIGDGTPSDRNFVVDEGAGASNPALRWDTTTNSWKTFDGTTAKDIGSGGGGGADAINILGDKNPGAEDGILDWTYAGTGSFAINSTASLVYDGDNSFDTDFNVQAETLKSSEVTLKQGLFGQACQARFYYIGGDDTIDITATVRNGNDAIVPGAESFILKAATIWTPVDLFFMCPSESVIGGDAQLGNLYLDFEQTGVGNAVTFRHDNVHVGGLIGLIELVLPDHFSARVDGDGTPAVLSENNDWINGAPVDNGVGDYTLNFITGTFPTLTPACTCTTEASATEEMCSLGTITNTSVQVFTRDDPGTAADAVFAIHCERQGADAKQSVTVFKNIPKVVENINDFSARMADDGTITSENADFINGNCVLAPAGTFTCSFNSGVFVTNAPSCVASSENTSVDTKGNIGVVTNSSVVIRGVFGASLSSIPLTIHCSKQGSDFKLPTVQPIIVGGQLFQGSENPFLKVFRLAFGGSEVSASGSTCTGSPCTIFLEKGAVNDWVNGNVTRAATGQYVFTTNAVFEANAYIHCNMSSSSDNFGSNVHMRSDAAANLTPFKTDGSGVLTFASSSIRVQDENGAGRDAFVSIICYGE